MKRIELFEFEDFAWLPSSIRSSCTNLIVVLHKLLGTKEVLSDLIIQAREKQYFDQITDLGSGSGGAMPLIIEELRVNSPNLKMLLTDLHPNPTLVEKFNAKNPDYLQYHPTAVNATHFQDTPQGLKTMVNSFHHMSPTVAKSILASAQSNRQPFLMYEIGENFVPTWLWWLLLPLSLCILILMSLLMTPFVRPIGWKQLLFTYLIPIVPLVYAWDGQASTMRTYTFSDIQEILPKADPNYVWTLEKAKNRKGKNIGYYLLGLPKKDV